MRGVRGEHEMHARVGWVSWRWRRLSVSPDTQIASSPTPNGSDPSIHQPINSCAPRADVPGLSISSGSAAAPVRSGAQPLRALCARARVAVSLPGLSVRTGRAQLFGEPGAPCRRGYLSVRLCRAVGIRGQRGNVVVRFVSRKNASAAGGWNSALPRDKYTRVGSARRPIAGGGAAGG
jgi:hypothetical protein